MIKKIWVTVRNIKIVKFSDDSYGIRKGWFFYRYKKSCNVFPWGWVTDSEVYKKDFDFISRYYEKRFVDVGKVVSYERVDE